MASSLALTAACQLHSQLLNDDGFDGYDGTKHQCDGMKVDRQEKGLKVEKGDFQGKGVETKKGDLQVEGWEATKGDILAKSLEAVKVDFQEMGL